jgi:hypothetical protein
MSDEVRRLDATTGAGVAPARASFDLALFVAASFSSAFVLFLLQPMFGRMALPLLGGAPAVWNTAMVFYQAVLLGGYLYAHALGRLKGRLQGAVHCALLAVAAVALPIAVPSWYPSPDVTAPTIWLVGLLAVSVGLPFFVVSAQAPLIQRWFAGTGDAHSADPYFLYAASNLGSLLALVAYPLLVEPVLGLSAQATAWSIAFFIVAGLVALAAWRGHEGVRATSAEMSPAIGWRRRLHWLALSAVPSGLLLAVTAHLSTDVMATPLLWVVPFILYLLTFVIVFARRPAISAGLAMRLAPFALIGAAALANAGAARWPIAQLVPICLCFFLVTLACHHALAATRPDPRRLSDFYFWMSLGGVVGGAFTALAAPLLFDAIVEYPLLVVAAAALVPGLRENRVVATPARTVGGKRAAATLMLAAAVACAVLYVGAASGIGDGAPLGIQLPAIVALILLALAAIGNGPRFAAHVLVCLLAFGGWKALVGSPSRLAAERGFFGVYRVERDPAAAVRLLFHGTTMHGAESDDPAKLRMPLTYYSPESGIGRVLAGARADARVGIVGLGSGSLACYSLPTQDWRFYEIDPLMVDIARDPKLFRYLSTCRPDVPVTIGDARLSLASEPDHRFDVLVIDAFASDAIPLHLITAEAFALYARVVADDGAILVHVSNRFLDLEPVLAAAAGKLGLAARLFHFDAPVTVPSSYLATSDWVALARSDGALATWTGTNSGWRPLAARPGFEAWTDDHAFILGVMRTSLAWLGQK